MSREALITELLQPVVEAMGFVWWGVEYHHNSVNAILRVYVDNADGNISIDDIVAITEQLNPILDVEDLISGNYTFEVSSPGLDRPLFTLAQFQRYVGEEIKCQLKTPLEGRRKYQGELCAVDLTAQTLTLNVSAQKHNKQVQLPFAQIDKAQLVPHF